MIDIGRERLAQSTYPIHLQKLAPITWILADVASEDLLSQPAIERNVDEHGGFDIISVCSAFVLLPSQRQAFRFWVENLLKKGGRIIVDVPKEDLTLHFLLTYHLPAAVGLPCDLVKGRLWIKDEDSLADMFEQVGLQVNCKLINRSYLQEVWHDCDTDTGLEVLQTKFDKDFHFIKDRGKLEESRRVWPRLWKLVIRKGPGERHGVEETHRLYVCIGQKL